MNRLIRGVERSSCFQRASTRAFSSSKTTSASVGAQNLDAHQITPNHRCCPIALTPSIIGSCRDQRIFTNDAFALNRNLSSLAANTVQESGGDVQDESLFTAPDRAPSALEQANLEEVTPGHCIFVLQKYAAKGNGKLIRQSDFVKLCESSRPGKKKDAKVIATALKEFKRCNNFVLQLEGSRAAVKGMLRSMTPTWKVQDGKPRVQAALFVAEQIVDETSGLYFAVETPTVDKVLEELHKGLLEMKENGINVKLDNIGDETESESEEEPSDVDKLLKDSLRLTEAVMKSLVKRKSRPEWDMKKRAKRKYLQRLQIGSGPFRNTLQAATKISILLGGGSAFAQEKIVGPFSELRSNYFVDPVTLKLIEEAKKVEEQEAAADEEAEGGADEEEDTEGEDDGTSDEEAGDSQASDEVEGEKKE